MEFNPGDIVEHITYPGVYFEVVEKRGQVFENVQFVDVSYYGGSLDHLKPPVREKLRDRLSHEDGIFGAHVRNLHQPLNGMEVLAVAWTKAEDE